MSSLLDLRTRIKNALALQGTVYDVDIDDSIRSAILEVSQYPMWFLETKGSVTLTTGSDSVALPANFASEENTRVLINGYYQNIKKHSFTELENAYRSKLFGGYPQNYAFWGDNIYVDVEANADYTIDLTYHKKDAELPQDDTDSSVWFNEGADVVRLLAMSYFVTDVQQDELTANPDQLFARYERALAKLRARNAYYTLRGNF